MPELRNWVLECLRQPQRAADFSDADWDLLIRQARHSNLLARLDWLFQQHPAVQPPIWAERHLEAARRVSDRQQIAVRYEIGQIVRAMRPLQQPVILLKGAAYVATGLAPYHGRMFSDIDIMVPKPVLERAEQRMLLAGWMSAHHDAYDQKYYRTWMHELPPLRHRRRGTVVDMHHTILPETARLKPDAARLIAAAVPVEGLEQVFVLAPLDMILHSATHLFHDGELENGLRDLVDLDALLRHFATDDGFWPRLQARAEEMDLQRPLYYALRYCRELLQTPVPESALAATSPHQPRFAALMDMLFQRALRPDHVSCNDAFTGLARWLLYVRSHHLRMPLHLLLPHLVRKAIKRRRESTPLGGHPLEKKAAD